MVLSIKLTRNFSHFDVASGIASYYGMVKWDLKRRQLELIYNLGDRNNKAIIKWDGKGDVNSDKTCRDKLLWFIATYGGPKEDSGTRQWYNGGVDDVNHKIWEAATSLWKYPRLI